MKNLEAKIADAKQMVARLESIDTDAAMAAYARIKERLAPYGVKPCSLDQMNLNAAHWRHNVAALFSSNEYVGTDYFELMLEDDNLSIDCDDVSIDLVEDFGNGAIIVSLSCNIPDEYKFALRAAGKIQTETHTEERTYLSCGGF